MSDEDLKPAYYENGGYRFDAQLIWALVQAADELARQQENERTPEVGLESKTSDAPNKERIPE